MSEGQFAERFAHPFLVLARTKSVESIVAGARKQAFATRGTAVASLEMVEQTMAYVSPIERRLKSKSRGRAKGDRPVTLGRTVDNDMVIPVPSVSGEHFEFIPPAEGEKAWAARDRGSKNGSFVDGVRMIPGQPYELTNGSYLELGRDVFGWFFNAAGLWKILRDGALLSEMLKRKPTVEEW
jgi:pSer/pThr/pTyr-binding forkhead associated (FHA) protein